MDEVMPALSSECLDFFGYRALGVGGGLVLSFTCVLFFLCFTCVLFFSASPACCSPLLHVCFFSSLEFWVFGFEGAVPGGCALFDASSSFFAFVRRLLMCRR
jgi:hypothetical protein